MEVIRLIKLIGHGKTRIGNKQFDLSDSIGAVTPASIGCPDNWYGGLIDKLYKTNEGFYICADKKGNLVNITYNESELTPEGLEILKEAGLYDGDIPESSKKSIDEMSRQELLDKAQELGIEGKIATWKTEKLVEEIKAAL